MPDLSGLDLQQRLTSSGRPIVFISGRSDVPSSVNAMKAGAFDFLTKPVEGEVLLGAVREAIEKDRNARENSSRAQELREEIAQADFSREAGTGER